MATRTTMNVSLPESLRKWIAQQVKDGGFGSASEYFRHLTRAEQRRQAQDQLEQLLLEGMKGPAREMTDADWAAIRARIRARAAGRRKRAG